MSFTLIIIGFLFLFNPNFNIIDIVPDFIGFFLIAFGIRRLSCLSGNVDLAKRYAYVLSGVELLKALSIGLTSTNDRTWYLLLAFSFGVVECILFYLFARELFVGIERLGVRYDAKYVLSSCGKGKRSRDVITRTHATSVAFFFARTALAVIPEFTVLNTDDINRDYTGLRSFLYLVGTAVVIVWSIFFIVRIVSFFNGTRRDTDFVDSINKAYSEYEANNTGHSRAVKMKLVILLLAAAVLTLFNFNEDGLAMVPTVIPALIITVASCMLIKDNGKAIFSAVLGLPLAAISVYGLALRQKFYHSDVVKFMDIFYYEKSMKLFEPVSNLMLVEFVLLTAQLLTFMYVLNTVVKNDISNKSYYLSSSNEANSSLKAELTAYLTKLTKISFWLTAAVAVVNTVNVKLCVLLGYLSLNLPYEKTNYYTVVYHGSVILATILTIALLYSATRLYSFVKEYVYTAEHIYGTSEE